MGFAEAWRVLRAVPSALRERRFDAAARGSPLAGATDANLKWIADRCGTSVEMIERHYAKWLGADDEQLALVGPTTRLAGRPRKVQP